MANWGKPTINNEDIHVQDGVRVTSHIQIEETDPTIYINRGKTFAQMGKFKQCEIELKKAISFAKNDAEKKIANEFWGHYELVSDTANQIKESLHETWTSGLWLLTHGWLVVVGIVLSWENEALAPLAIAGVITLMNLISSSSVVNKALFALWIQDDNVRREVKTTATRKCLAVGVKLCIKLYLWVALLMVLVRDEMDVISYALGIPAAVGFLQLMVTLIKATVKSTKEER